MGLERPVWTCCFFFIWILILPGMLLTHLSVSKVIPAIGDLPKNIVKGFDNVFKFKALEADSGKIKVESQKVVEACGRSISWCTTSKDQPFCQPDQNLLAQQAQGMDPNAQPGGGRRLMQPCLPVDTTIAKGTVEDVFSSTLTIVQKVSNDKYFGTPGLQDTADNLNTISAEMAQVVPLMDCSAAVPIFCEMYLSSDSIVSGIGDVNAAIDAFKNGDIIKQWDKNKGILTVLHALPYFMVIALLSISVFWYKRGVCCCCEGGTWMGCCFIPFYLFWMVSFVLYIIVLGIGSVIKFASSSIPVPVLKGEPSLEEAIEHIKDKFPEFWTVVFEDLEKGLAQLWDASVVFTLIAITIFIYSNCLCCCRPYQKKNDAKVVDMEVGAPKQQGMEPTQVK